ncbi:geranylgeranylglyceryl/heptaprenylglyceryl phosphate synthase [Antarcticibacterium arcticum]|uniref:Geranylgeranylglyceryl phosphate synthase n=1 Tax=Antarcticibacterium arcticum TaxID=2585771 RepID=A0A5B8YKP1_9FLAO|nr:geranylgeranylglyceryl/heptaprenylglyceryl phosphate synthase [Antarcticibacterium arcticum]QED38265.1 geranylgeranylglyceryl/heptaprenylglyceryl phosphate synthase [Antarcticibacterium arcticum]
MILSTSIYKDLISAAEKEKKLLAVLIDPDKFNSGEAEDFFRNLPKNITHIFVGGSTAENEDTQFTVNTIKKFSSLPVILFPGDHSQITEEADAILFLSLISGRNPEYLIEQQVRSVARLRQSSLEIIPTGYILIDGGRECAVERVSQTRPISQNDIEKITDTALAGQFSGKKLIYLEAGSGASVPVASKVISAVKRALSIPLIVGGGIRTGIQLEKAYEAGADLVVIGTAFEEGAVL